MRDEEPISLAAVLTALILLGCFSYVVMRFAPSRPPEIAVAPPPVADTGRCSEVVGQCVASADVSFESTSAEGLCDEVRGKQRLEESLGNPLVLGTCPQAVEGLAANCPAGCQLAGDRNLIIPGKVKIEVAARANEAGTCLGHGELPLTVRGTCTRHPGG